jgi:peptide/nickel transport system permease protein
MLAGSQNVSPDAVNAIRERLGLNQPIIIQYSVWVQNLLRGDLGYSFIFRQPVIELIGSRVWHTVELVLVTQIVALVLAIFLGATSAVKKYSLVDAASSVGAVIGYSLPNFWIGLIMIIIFSLWFNWLPVGGVQTLGKAFTSLFDAWTDHLWHLILPVCVLGFERLARLFRLVRSSMLEVLRKDYIMTARAKGLKERVVVYKHALRNALLPVLTYVGYSMGYILGGTIVIETVFSWPGLGQFIVEIAQMRDFPSLMGISMFIAIMVLFASLCTDIAYHLVDPRIRYD